MKKSNEKLREVSKKTSDGKTTTISVREIENGWVMRESIESKDSKGNYKWEEKETFYEEDPLKELNIKW